MGLTKTDKFNKAQNDLASLIKAMGHPARIAIIEHLLKVNRCISKDIVEELPLAQTTIVQHLRELKNANVILGSIEGNAICYCLNPQKFEFLQSYFQNISNKLAQPGQCC